MTPEVLSVPLQLGLLYSLPAIAVALSFRVVGFPDLTPDGSFTFGAALASVILVRGGNELIAVLAAMLGGAAVGVLTATIHSRLRVSKLLSGILVMTVLYSVNLRVMQTSNIGLLRVPTFFGDLTATTNIARPVLTIGVLVGLVILVLWAFLGTEVGLRVRAGGEMNSVLEARGIATTGVYAVALAISNGLAGLSGALIAEYQGFSDVSMGMGLVIVCLAAVIIGETVIKPERVVTLLLSPILGMVLYQGILAVTLRMGLHATDLKLISGLLVLAFIAAERFGVRSGMASRQIGNRSV